MDIFVVRPLLPVPDVNRLVIVECVVAKVDGKCDPVPETVENGLKPDDILFMDIVQGCPVPVRVRLVPCMTITLGTNLVVD